MTKQQICINVEKALLTKIDTGRGDIPRSRVVERCLEKTYGKSEQKTMGSDS
jgi:hypothetical protein